MTPPKGWDKSYFVKSDVVVKLAIKYPSFIKNEKNLRKQIIDNRIVVEDPDSSHSYLSWLDKTPITLKQPIQIINPFLPPSDFCIIYTDGSPGRLRVYPVAVDHGDSFETEARVLIEAARLAQSLEKSKVIFISDCLNLMEALQGRKFIHKDYAPLFRELEYFLYHYDEKMFLHIPREGLMACDVVAKYVKLENKKSFALDYSLNLSQAHIGGICLLLSYIVDLSFT